MLSKALDKAGDRPEYKYHFALVARDANMLEDATRSLEESLISSADFPSRELAITLLKELQTH